MSDNRLAEILQKLNDLHTEGEAINPDEMIKLQCQWDNDRIGHLNEFDGLNCDLCKNKGEIYFLKKNEYNCGETIYRRDCKCMATRRTLRRAKESGLDDILRDYTFDKYETPEAWQKEIKERAQAFCKDDNARWFYIGGQTGAGKTHICTAIAAHYIKAGKDCRYMLWRDDAVKLKSTVNDFKFYQPQIDEFKKVDVLYIDDFLKVKDGTEPTTADIHLAFELLNYRLPDKSKITIISSEFSITRALEFDEATIGRVYQQTGAYKINIARDINRNYRLKE